MGRMDELIPFVEQSGGTVVDLGSRDGHDAARIADIFQASRVVTIEANPECFADIERTYPQFDNHNVAISDGSEAWVDFWAVRKEFGPDIVGMSSTLWRPDYNQIADKISVPCTTMDSFVTTNSIDAIEVMKVDIEGATYEAMLGFTKVRMVRVFHLELEHQQFWRGQHTYEDTAKLMRNSGYSLRYFAFAYHNQSDSIWVRNEK